MRRFSVWVVLAALVSVLLVDSARADQVVYSPPIAAPVADDFRPPSTPFGAGNRGIEYQTVPGRAVSSAAAGVVSFAGPVAGRLIVSITHADGVRTTYSGLAAEEVSVGDRVERGEVLGTSGSRLHVGARVGEAYVDPGALWSSGRPRVYLIPSRSEAGLAADRIYDDMGGVGVADALRAGWGLVADGSELVRDRLGELLVAYTAVREFVAEVVDGVARIADFLGFEELATSMMAINQMMLEWDPVLVLARVATTTAELRRAQRNCTPPETPAPRLAPRRRRLAVFVAGLGSDSQAPEPFAADMVGYEPDQVVRFSYRGGAVPGTGRVHGIEETHYDGDDTTVDLNRSGERLADLLEDLNERHPGVPIDVIAHSQGGVVARLALDEHGGESVENLVTLGSPHGGADVASALELVSTTDSGSIARRVVGMTGLMTDGVSVSQLAEWSPVIERLEDLAPPEGVSFTSIGSDRDLVVPLGATRTSVSEEVVVGGVDHGDLASHPAVMRELSLALAGRGPTCRSTGSQLGSVLLGELVAVSTDAVATVATVGLHRLDAATPAPVSEMLEVGVDVAEVILDRLSDDEPTPVG